MWLALSAGFVGLVHSLSPSHWLPVILMAKSRQWSMGKALIGALIAAAGHIVLSVVLSVVGIGTGAYYLASYEAQIEAYSGLVLVVFGVIFALLSYFRHSSCRGHTHHGPEPMKDSSALLFLFSIGFSPCIAVFPLFVAAAPLGLGTLISVMVVFSLGVIVALTGATFLVSLGLMKLDHPLFEHYGDVITGISVAVIGLILFKMG